jgi:hypothetical protein
MSSHGYKTLVAVVTLLTSLNTQAQFRHFNNMYNHKGWWDNAVGVVDLGNHYLVAGTTADLLSPDSSYYRSLWLYYLDSAGNKGNERLIHFPYQFAGVGPVGAGRNFLTKISEGKYLFTGTLSDTNQNVKMLLIEFDSSLLEIKLIIDSSESAIIPYDTKKFGDGGYLVGGYYKRDSQGRLIAFLARFGQSGVREWFKSYENSTNSIINSVDCSGLFDCFATYSVIGGVTTIVKVDTSGTWLNQKQVLLNNSGLSIKKSQYGGYLIYGSKAKAADLISDRYGMLGRIDDSLNLIWIDTIRLARFSHFIDVFELPGGNIIAVGETDNVNAFNGTTIAWCVKVSSNGQYLREKLYLYEDGRPSHMWGASSTSDGGIICVGTAQNDYEPSPYGQDAWVMKIDTNLCDTPGCSGVIIGTTADEEFKTNDVKVYPNPFNNDVNLIYSLRQDESEMCVKVYNMMGTEIYRQENLPNRWINSIALNLSQHQTGIYLIKLFCNGTQIATKKVIKN